MGGEVLSPSLLGFGGSIRMVVDGFLLWTFYVIRVLLCLLGAFGSFGVWAFGERAY